MQEIASPRKRQQRPLNAPPGRPRKLTREQIISVATKLISEQSPQALTLRSLGSALGVQFSTIYNYFSNIEQLVEAIVQELLSTIPLPDVTAEGDLRAQLIDHYLSLRKVLIQHPEVLDRKPGSVSWMWSLRKLEAELEVLAQAGLPPERAIMTIGALNGVCAASASMTRLWGVGKSGPLQQGSLAGVKPAKLPNVARLLKLSLAKLPAEEAFRQTLTVLLDHDLSAARVTKPKTGGVKPRSVGPKPRSAGS